MSSAPSGINTPSDSRYSTNSRLKGRMTVDLMLRLEKRGYHDENWNASRASCDITGNTAGVVIADGIRTRTQDEYKQASVDYRHRQQCLGQGQDVAVGESEIAIDSRMDLRSLIDGSTCVRLSSPALTADVAAYHLLEEYKLASAALQASVEELQLSTQKVC